MNYNIPGDIVASEILTRLPVKSLLKFRCVSKSWCSLISYDVAFIKSHLKNSTNNKTFTHHAIIASIRIGETSNFTFKHCSFPSWFYESSSFACEKFTTINDNFSPPQDFSVVGCCNGLCCLRKNKDVCWLEDEFFLWNPATGMSHKLPAYVLSSDQLHYSLVGFGFDEVHDDYKVLAITRFENVDDDDNGVVKQQLYSLKTNSWKLLENNFDTKNYFEPNSAKFLNGKLHWVAENTSLGKQQNIICCFDLENDVHGIVEIPNHDRDRCFLESVGVLDGCLSCMINSNDKTMYVWVMKHYGRKDSWHLSVDISFSQHLKGIYMRYDPLCIGQGGEIMFCDHNFGGFVIYDPKNKLCTSLSWPDIVGLDADVYIQSLVSPVPPGNQ